MQNLELKHLNQASISQTELTIDALSRIAPSCITEVKDSKTGSIKHAVDFHVLRQLLGDSAVEDKAEAYEFTWVGKQEARREAAKSITKTLRPVPEDSVDWDNTQNLYIEGDNLEVLKLLQKSYLGKVKMIYIDPPYNTGNDFVYHDDFAMSADEYAEASGSVDELGNKYIKNMDSNGRFHSDWCSMIYSRLMVARTLLAEDGVIFISIDEHEEENLKKISNEIFGCSNFVGTIIWERAFAPKNDAKYLSDSHDYVLVFAKTIDKFQIGLLPRSEEANARYKNPDNDPRGPWTADNMTVKTYSANYDYEIVTPNGSVMSPPNGRCWFTSKERMDKLIQENRVWFGETGGNMPRLKRFLSDVQQGMTATTIWKYTEVGHNQEGRQELKKLFDNKGYFDGPKPLRLISRILTIANLSANSIILDFFSGSATTAHAVMQLNAEDGGNRQYIMVQIPEETPEDSEARKAGYNTIPEIAKERIRRAGKKIKEESPLTTADLDTGFRVFRLDEGNYEDVKRSPKEFKQDQLDLFLNNIKADRNDLDLLFGCMLDWGVQLSLPMTQEVVDGKTIYTVNDGDLVACFAENVSEDVVKAMADKMPLRVIFRDSCFAQDADKINIYETFKQKLDWSDQEVVKNIRVI